ncbi:dihydrolipoyllysine-residue succinyltransferase [candidate division KSB1 bacterium]|nr:dihydrolipoyllysine-residue succinyltransferase [candidate division KSB1 bacterium]
MMKVDMVMPQMGESIVEGTIVKWLKHKGDAVEKEEIILEISTDKVDSEIPSPASGILDEILAEEGETVQVGGVIARIESNKKPGKAAKTEEPQPRQKEEEYEQVSAEEDRGKVFLSPVVKKIARENDISLNEVKTINGSGAHGRITKSDILEYISSKGKEKPSGQTEKAASTFAEQTEIKTESVTVIPMDHVRKRIAEHMVMSKKTAPHVTTVAEADLTKIVTYREKAKKSFEEQHGVKLTFTSFFVQAIASALKQFPLLNSSVDGDRILQKKDIHIGIAVGLEDKLIVPVIRHADDLSLIGIAKALADLTLRTRDKKLNPEDVQGGTFSLTNIGTYGNLFGTPIINQPQVGILGTGAIKERPVVVDGMIAIRNMIYLSLTYDHRIIDGLYAGRFMQTMVKLLQEFSSS